MSTASAITPFDPEEKSLWSKESCRLSRRLCDLSAFLQRLRVQMRYGELTRAPLQLVRFQMKENVAECEWLARQPDPWDEGLHPSIGLRHASLQALQDAVNVRSLLFDVLPGVDSAYLRIYRQRIIGRDLVIVGHVQRLAPSFRKVHSVAMRAKLLGFRFTLQNDILGSLQELTNLELVDW
jgi:hypothetical protein